ncbi:MAG TPA: type III ribulose-bisphosphate carboxylase [Euryarchaeota archaeon]|nr:MAG: type III ribulose-bisphosphate carboxylase [Thermoplasmatales archaeon ex4484_6]RLF68413.1 MAG: type III ribulose-bisphosphate carboxylase [Thermoplasmata archaeon]HHD15089.1 type III ribulose-bisphosphate carboxylase [Euryarchaeota archaeon]
MAKIDWYDQFVDLSYVPSDDEIKVLFSFEPPEGMSREESAGRIASESSTGTWTTLSRLPDRMKGLEATVYEIEGNLLKVAYPLPLWEEGNVCQLMSGIAGNIFGMKGVEKLRLLDAQLPRKYLKGHRGPNLSMKGVRRMMKVHKRPLTGAVPKPKVGFSALEHAKVGYETWMGGFDFVKDDENLTSQRFNRFEKRVEYLSRFRDKAESRTGDLKDAFINITAETEEMKRRADLLHDHGFRYAMVDVVVAGFAAVQTIREYTRDLGMAIHAHRAMHSAFTRDPSHGISMQFIAKIMRLIGVNQIHSGTAVGKLVGSREEVLSIADILRERVTPGRENLIFEQDWGPIRSAFPVSSGGLHPGLVPDVLDIYGTDLVLLVSGGIHGHPDGTRAGAKAAMQAVEAWMDGISLEEKARGSRELARALEKWGHHRPR